MRAAIIDDGALRIEERDPPEPREGEIRIRMHAAGINGADLAQRAGGYPAPPGTVQDIPGLECAGEADDGRRVMALLPGGGHAEVVTVDERHVLPVPETVTLAEAGGVMEVFATAHDALFTQAQLQAGERLLVNGAAGGVGVAAVQLGVALGAYVSATARPHHDERSAMGVDLEPDGRYDVILELVGGGNLATDVERLATNGRLAVIGVGAGATQEIKFHLLMRARGRIHGSTLRSRSAEEKAAVVARLRDDVLPLLADGRVRVPVEATFALEDAQEAYERFASGGKFGKLVITA